MSTQLTRQERLFGVREAEYGNLVAANERLYPFITAVNDLVDRAKLDPTDDGIEVSAVDAANVAMLKASLPIDGEVPQDTVALDVSDLSGQLQNKPRDATVTVECGVPNGVLRLEEEFANGRMWNVRERVSFVDPDMVRERPDIPDLEFDTTVELSVGELSKMVGRYANDRAVRLRVEDGELSIGEVRGSADIEDGEYAALATTHTESDSNAEALYSPEYLDTVVSSINRLDADTVTLAWAEEYPLRIEVEGEFVTATWIMAPRIQS